MAMRTLWQQELGGDSQQVREFSFMMKFAGRRSIAQLLRVKMTLVIAKMYSLA